MITLDTLLATERAHNALVDNFTRPLALGRHELTESAKMLIRLSRENLDILSHNYYMQQKEQHERMEESEEKN